MIDRRTRMFWSMLTAALIAMPASACRRSTQDASAEAPDVAEGAASAKPQVLFFAKALRVEDDSVNQFVERFVKVAVSGDYDKLRLLWTPRVEPMSKADFEESWHDVRRVTIRLLTQVFLGGASVGSPDLPKAGFAMVADIQFDPASVPRGGERGRQVALTMLREDGEWRLAAAPKGLRNWMNEQIKNAPPTPADEKPTPTP